MWTGPDRDARASLPALISLFALAFSLEGCSFLNRRIGAQEQEGAGIAKYLLTDKSGKFVVERHVGVSRKNGKFVVKRQLLPEGGDTSRPFERSISISRRSQINEDLKVLVPEIAQYSVWFEGQRYFSQMKVSGKGKLEVRTKGPDKKDNKTQNFVLPKGTGVNCFFSQLIECVGVTGFFGKARENGGGKINFHVLWDGYPYFQEQYTALGDRPYAQAVLEFDGKSEQGDERYTLRVEGQNIFFFLGKEGRLTKVFWVSEGFSMVEAEDSEGHKRDTASPDDVQDPTEIDTEVEE